MSEKPAPVLELEGITKSFGAFLANDNINLKVNAGEIVALLGENGAGKTTLMNILFGHYTADQGRVIVNGEVLPPDDPAAALKAGVGMVHQHFTLADNLTVLENITLGTERLTAWRSRKQEALKTIETLSERFGLEVSPHSKIAALSVGERQRVEILKALYGDTKVLILDEPTAVLTPGESDFLFQTLKQLVTAGLAVIFITHKLNEVLKAANRIAVLRAGRMVGERLPSQTNAQELAALMVGDEISMPTVTATAAGETLLELKALSLAAEGGTSPLQNVNLALRAGTITGIAGVSGNGQSRLANLLCGLEAPPASTLYIDGQAISDWTPKKALDLRIGRIPEDRHRTGSIGDMSMTENGVIETYTKRDLTKRGFLDWGLAKRRAEMLIESYDVRCPGPQTSIRQLSGGNIQKFILGRVLDQLPQIIIANQPTRGLDVGAVAYVHEKLLAARRFGSAILLISEDLDEVIALSDPIHVMFRGELSEPFTRDDVSIPEIGAMMAGRGFEREESTHAH